MQMLCFYGCGFFDRTIFECRVGCVLYNRIKCAFILRSNKNVFQSFIPQTLQDETVQNDTPHVEMDWRF